MWDGLTPPYSTIVADPPWRYTKEPTPDAGRASNAESVYSTMDMRDVAALPVKELAAPNAHLYLWVTTPRLFGDRDDDSFTPRHILRAWGFDYITTLTWVKTGAPGMGWYFRGDTEHLIFGVRGKCPIPPELRTSNVVTAARGRHSEKPAAALDLIQRVSPSPWVELFCRQPRFGWDSWGWGYEGAAS
jgi:N6-adenosine-specific RNA methylase IME4